MLQILKMYVLKSRTICDKELIGLHEQKHCQSELKGMKREQNKGKLKDMKIVLPGYEHPLVFKKQEK